MVSASDKVVQKMKTYFMFTDFLFENPAVYEIMWKKYCRFGQGTEEKMADAVFMLDT